MGNNPTRAKLKKMIQDFKVDMVAIPEPMIKDSEIDSLGRYLEIPGRYTNGRCRRKLWVLWQQTLQVTSVTIEEQHCTLDIQLDTERVFGLFVYAKCTMIERRELWSALDSFGGNLAVPWLVAEDFNAVITVKRG